jgi:hypothetical protein
MSRIHIRDKEQMIPDPGSGREGQDLDPRSAKAGWMLNILTLTIFYTDFCTRTAFSNWPTVGKPWA